MARHGFQVVGVRVGRGQRKKEEEKKEEEARDVQGGVGSQPGIVERGGCVAMRG